MVYEERIRLPPPPHPPNNVTRDERSKRGLRSEDLLLTDIVVDCVPSNEHLKLL